MNIKAKMKIQNIFRYGAQYKYIIFTGNIINYTKISNELILFVFRVLCPLVRKYIPQYFLPISPLKYKSYGIYHSTKQANYSSIFQKSQSSNQSCQSACRPTDHHFMFLNSVNLLCTLIFTYTRVLAL